MASTPAERQARYRARRAESLAKVRAQDEVLEEVRAVRQAVDNLAKTVDSLARRVTDRDVTARKRDGLSRDGGGRARDTRVREAPAPYGGLGASSRNAVTEDLAHLVGSNLVGRGSNSVGAIVDFLSSLGHSLTAAQVAEALVGLQAKGHARRDPGEGPAPDRWLVVQAPTPDAIAPPLQVVRLPDLHVTCSDYQAHGSAHAWDASLAAFRCGLCNPSPEQPGGMVNGHA